MKILKNRQKCVVILTVLCIFLFTFIAYAAPASKSYPNFAGITTAIAEKDVSYVSTYDFNCISRSYTTSPSVSITHLGYNTFSCTVLRDGANAGSWTRPGNVNWNSNYHVDSGKVSVYPGYSYRKVTAAGSHDFGHFNGQTYDWDPSLSANGTYYP